MHYKYNHNMNVFIKKTSLICIIVIIELFSLWFFKYSPGTYIGQSGQTFNEFLREYGGYQFFMAAYSQRLLVYGLLTYLLICIFIVSKEIGNPQFLSTLNRIGLSRTTVLGGILTFFALLGILIIIQNPEQLVLNPYSWQSILYAISPLIWAAYTYSICDALFPIKEFLKLGGKNKPLIFIILVGVFFLSNPGLTDVLVKFWSSLLLIPTIDLTSRISHIFGLGYEVLPGLVGGAPVFGSSQFKVEIFPVCSGYEGMSLIAILLGAYLMIQRESLIMHRAIPLIPIAGLIMFLLNAFRIFLLVAIGHYWSPEVAINGFHIVGGWLNLLITFVLALLVLNLQFFQKEERTKMHLELGSTALLVPLISLIVVGLLTKAIYPDFSWLYPVHVLIAAFVLYYFRKPFLLFLTRPSFISIAIGVVVSILWILLIPVNQEQSTHFMNELSTAPLWLAILWVLFRAVGAAVIVPIAEEFAFRGYIQPHLQDWLDRKGLKSASVIASLGITSLLFGYVHSDILAGSVAGLFFGLAYLQRRQLMDAVMAHAVTNALLALYVIGFGYWSYW